jgi:hypothetical protein
LGSGVFADTGSGLPLTISVPQGAVSAYIRTWGVSVSTRAGGNGAKYGDNHRAITIAAGVATP